jgi:Immunity protein Imm1
VNSPSGKVLSFGVLEGHAYVEFSDDWDDGPHFVPVGDPARSQGDGVATFWFTSHHTELSLRNCVRLEQILPLVREFFETDARPTSIGWEEV